MSSSSACQGTEQTLFPPRGGALARSCWVERSEVPRHTETDETYGNGTRTHETSQDPPKLHENTRRLSGSTETSRGTISSLRTAPHPLKRTILSWFPPKRTILSRDLSRSTETPRSVTKWHEIPCEWTHKVSISSTLSFLRGRDRAVGRACLNATPLAQC